MKATISLPDQLFAQADQYMQKFGMNRCELLMTALQQFHPNPQRDDLIDRINAICTTLDTALPEDIATETRRKLLKVEW